MAASEQFAQKGTTAITSSVASEVADEIKQSVSSDTTWSFKTREQRATILNSIFLYPEETTTTLDLNYSSGANQPISSPERVASQGAIQTRPVEFKRRLRNTTTPSPRSNINFLEIIRAHFIKLILEALQKVQPHAGKSSTAVYVNQILHKIREMENRSPDDPILEFMFALYDALACDGLWATYTSVQYEKAGELLRRLAQKSSIRSKDIEKAIIAIEDIGFDTTPYSFEMDDEGIHEGEV